MKKDEKPNKAIIEDQDFNLFTEIQNIPKKSSMTKNSNKEENSNSYFMRSQKHSKFSEISTNFTNSGASSPTGLMSPNKSKEKLGKIKVPKLCLNNSKVGFSTNTEFIINEKCKYKNIGVLKQKNPPSITSHKRCETARIYSSNYLSQYQFSAIPEENRLSPLTERASNNQNKIKFENSKLKILDLKKEREKRKGKNLVKQQQSKTSPLRSFFPILGEKQLDSNSQKSTNVSKKNNFPTRNIPKIEVNTSILNPISPQSYSYLKKSSLHFNSTRNSKISNNQTGTISPIYSPNHIQIIRSPKASFVFPKKSPKHKKNKTQVIQK